MIDRFCGIYSSPLKARIPLICERFACVFATICFLGNLFHTFCMEISCGSPYGLCVIHNLQNIVCKLCKTAKHLLCDYCGCGDSRCFFAKSPYYTACKESAQKIVRPVIFHYVSFHELPNLICHWTFYHKLNIQRAFLRCGSNNVFLGGVFFWMSSYTLDTKKPLFSHVHWYLFQDAHIVRDMQALFSSSQCVSSTCK